MKAIVSVVGTRPNFIKLAALSPELRRHFHEVIIHTGQHYDYNMNNIFFDGLNIPKPDFSLGCGGGSHAQQVGDMMKELETALSKIPDIAAVISYGDTNSSFVAAFVARRMGFPVIHVEAGLRSLDMNMPEEQNRIMIDGISDYLFCPTQSSYDRLVDEGRSCSRVYQVGDVHASLFNRVFVPTRKPKQRSHILCTIHRPANTDDPVKLGQIVRAFATLGKHNTLLFSAHPRTLKKLQQYGQAKCNLVLDHIHLLEPQSYLKMLEYVDQAQLVITDSGGIQKEAYFCSTPCVTVRDSTEWVETLRGETKFNRLADATIEDIMSAVATTQRQLSTLTCGNQDRTLFGLAGDPAKDIADILQHVL